MLLTTSAALAAGVISVKITWRDLPPMPIGVAGGASAPLGDGKLLYAGGTTWVGGVKHWLRDVHLYDPARKSWTPGPELPEPLAYGGQATTRDGLEVFGGLNQNGLSKNCWRFNTRQAQWSQAGQLPQDAVLSRVERVENADYLFGGCSDAAVPMHCTSSVWKRDTTGKWTHTGEMPDGAISLRAGAVLDGHIYLFGGCSEVSGGVVNRDSAYRYDPATGQWRKLGPLPAPVRGMTAATIGAGRILLAGGYKASAQEAASSGPEYGFTDEVWIYDAGQDRYQRATSLPFAVSGIEIIVHNGMILALGGEDRMRSRSHRLIQGTFE